MSIRPFLDTLRELRGGQTLDELAVKLHEAVAAVQEHGKAAELKLILTIKPFSTRGLAEAPILVEDEIALKLPKGEREFTVFFATPEGNLSRHQQRQPDLPGVTVAVDNQKGAA